MGFGKNDDLFCHLAALCHYKIGQLYVIIKMKSSHLGAYRGEVHKKTSRLEV